MVTDEFRELNKETSKDIGREREGKKKKSSARKERERGRANETEGERAREHKRTEGHGSLRWRFGVRATTGFILCRAHPPPPPTYSDVRVLEKYYLNKYPWR
jgi:hypothetical protein